MISARPEWVLCLILAAAGSGCQPSRPAPPESPPDSTAPGPVQEPALRLEQVDSVVRAILADPSVPLHGLRRNAVEQEGLDRLYQDPGPLWLTARGDPRPIAGEALALLLDSGSEGLEPADYGAAPLDSLARELQGGSRDPGAAARFDLGLSLATLRYLRHLHSGRVEPRQIGFRMAAPGDGHDFASLLATALAGRGMAETAADLAPPLPQYHRLREALARYRQLAAAGTGDSVQLTAVLRPGDSAPGLSRLIGRLHAVGDLDPALAVDSAVYGGAVEAGVRRFQTRHGLEPDGVVGRETVAELNVPLAWRVRQLAFALERLRWLPDLTAGRFVIVNIPMFELAAFDSLGAPAPALRTGVVVGKALSTETPVLVEQMRYLIFQPYWNVPPSILRNEVLPALRRDSAYLRKNDMEIVQGPGDDAIPLAETEENLARLASGRLRVRQRPGPGNALGRVKFMFPNDESVYLHGTPAQELFSRARRDFSHGCVRVEDPPALAAFVLRELPEWTPGRIAEAMTTGPLSRRVNLPSPIPVLLYYTTAQVELDGTVRFARDLYGHDQVLDRALAAAGR